MSEQKSAADPAAAFPAAAFMDGWFRTSRQMIELMGRCAARLVAFTGERMEADLRLGRRLAECRDMAAVARVQGEWLQEALEQYRREFQAAAEEMWKAFQAMREEVSAAATAAAEPSTAAEPKARERRAAA
ncbi:MAG: phasin family protein [Geminicoccaceae bacterium]|nr:phasin family protein [Geminicoccaceae bacterium]MDW8341603.1 phasin family protein [Geminicoccaceae bacterium]